MTPEEIPMDLFRDLLTQMGWPWTEPDDISFTGVIAGATARWEWAARYFVEQQILAFRSIIPMSVPPGRRASANEYLAMANWKLLVATFEIDFASGQVNCRTHACTSGMNSDAVEQLVLANFTAMDLYLPGLMAVVFGKVSPKRAIANLVPPVPPPAEAGDDAEVESPVPNVNSDATPALAPSANPTAQRGRFSFGDN